MQSNNLMKTNNPMKATPQSLESYFSEGGPLKQGRLMRTLCIGCSHVLTAFGIRSMARTFACVANPFKVVLTFVAMSRAAGQVTHTE